MVKRISMDVHGYRVLLTDRGEVWMNDNDVLYFGNDLDVSMKWDGDKLIVLPLTDNVGSFEIGDGTTNMDFKLFAPNDGKVHWDADANVLYIIATTMMGYGSQFQFTPGGVGAGTGISFYNTSQYIRSAAANVLEISGQAYLGIVSKVVLSNTIELARGVTPYYTGELALASDNRLEYAVNETGLVYRVPFYCHTDTSDVVLPTGIGLQLGDKLGLQVSTVAATILGDVYLDSDDNYITYSVGGGLEYKCAVIDNTGHLRLPCITTTATVRGQMYLDSDNRIMYSPGSSLEYKLLSYQDVSPGVFAIPANISLHCGYFFKLWSTLTLPTEEGQMVWRSNEKRLCVHNGTTTMSVAWTTD